MVFSDTSQEKAGLIQDCEMLVFNEYGKITDNTELLANFTNNLNRAYDKAVSIIIENDGRWQYDDHSNTDTAIVTANIVSGQTAYTLSVEHLKITQVRIQDSSANWHLVQPIDQEDPVHKSYIQHPSTITQGIPRFYDKNGDQLLFYPQPDYSVTDGIELRVQRTPNYFTTDDAARSAGIASIFHRYLSLSASMDYAVVNSLAQKNDLAEMLRQVETRVEKFYSRRDRDDKKQLRAIKQTSR